MYGGCLLCPLYPLLIYKLYINTVYLLLTDAKLLLRDSINLQVLHIKSVPRGGAGGGVVLSYKRLLGICRWTGSQFHDWSDYNGVAFSIELLEWGRKFSNFGGR